MKIAELISGIMMRLAAIPGLSFLQTYVMSAQGMKTRFGQRKGDYEAYVAAGRGAVDDVRSARGGNRNQDVDLVDGEEDDYVYDYDDDEEESVRSDDLSAFEDDYPVSDEFNTYYDDDYRSS